MVARKQTTISYLVIKDTAGEWVFAVPTLSPVELRSGLQPLKRYITSREPPDSTAVAVAAPAAAAVEEPAVRLERLSGLLERGHRGGW